MANNKLKETREKAIKVMYKYLAELDSSAQKYFKVTHQI